MPVQPEIPTAADIDKIRQLLKEAGDMGDSAVAFSAQRVLACAGVGDALIAWQKQLGRGHFGFFVAQHFPELEERTRRRWMRLATLRAEGKIDFEKSRSMRQIFTLAQLLPEQEGGNAKQTKTGAAWLVFLSRLMRELELLDIESMPAEQRSTMAERLDAVTRFRLRLTTDATTAAPAG